MKDILWLMILYLLLSWSSQHLHLPHLLHINKEKCLERGKKFLIFPGTKWCGYGDKAKDYNDLGRFAVTDRCCRDHDHCPDRIHSHETKYNLHNGGQFTRMLCKCDGVFYTCLKTAHSKVSKEVGTAYFNLMTNKCFSFEHPISRCRRFHSSQLGWPSLGLLIVLAQQLSQVSNNLWLGGDMYEGTNWCGFGERVEELGELQGLDSCCRDLAHCNQTIRPGHEDYGIDNPGLDPMYHCSCTSVFYKCLKIQSTNAPTIREREAAESVGDMFFNFEPRKCLKFEKPILGCDRYPLVDKCKQYKLNKEGKKLWQLFDTQLF